MRQTLWQPRGGVLRRVGRVAGRQHTEPAAAFLAELAGDGTAPRARDRHRPRGAAARFARRASVRIDSSEAMVDRLRAKSGGAEIPVAFGDFADLSVAARFA